MKHAREHNRAKLILVFDATPLIYLAKAKFLPKVRELGLEMIIPHGVYVEVVVRGKEKNKHDAWIIEQLVKEEVFRVQKSPRLFGTQYTLLSEADREVIALAKECEGAVIADDEEVRRVAEVEGVQSFGSLYLLFRLLQTKKIKREEVKSCVDKMIEQGWYCSIEVYTTVLKELEK